MRTLTEQDVLQTIREKVEASGLRAMAREVGLSAGFLSEVVNGVKPVSEAAAHAFGFERVVTVVFRKKAA